MMLRLCLLAVTALASATTAVADSVLDWNATSRVVMQSDGSRPVNQANPGWSTRAQAMMNGAIYDVFQAVDRTHTPLLVNTRANANTSLDAAVHQAAYEILLSTYSGESNLITAAYNSRMATVTGDAQARANGIALGSRVAQQYIADRANDRAGETFPYTHGTEPGQWWPQPGQTAWGPGWGEVRPFAIDSTQPFVDALPDLPALDSQEYADAFNMLKDYGGMNSQRTNHQTDTGLFWAYDRSSMGPPPIMFNQNLEAIATQADNSSADNARLYALASVAMADAATASWDSKFTYNFWRPIAALQGQRSDMTTGHDDGNPETVEDPNWRPLGAPGDDPQNWTDDFTPPFPAWTSGHATMGGAMFKAIELFYGTNNFDAIDGVLGNDPTYTLQSAEWDWSGTGNMSREFSTFTQVGAIDIGTENSPEGENAMSRVYLGVHWIMDQRDGTYMGNDIAAAIFGSNFRAVPEPSSIALVTLAIVVATGVLSKRR